MNKRLSDTQIRTTCRALLAIDGRLSGRRLCAELRRRFGAVGKTEHVFAIWREERAAAGVHPDVVELRRQLAAAQAVAAENLVRAERAEFRERAHQEQWAREVDRLRLELRRWQAGRPT